MKCGDCKEKKAIIVFSGEPMMTITRGWGKEYLCRQCLIKRIEEHIKDCKENFTKQKKLLEDEDT